MIQVNRIYLIFNRLVTKKFLVDTSDYPYVSKYIYRTQDLAKVASFSDSKPQKQHYAKINGLEKLIINTGNEPFH